MELVSKLPNTGTTIFSVMTAMAIEHGAINLAQGFPNFSPDEALIDSVADYMRKGMNQYAPMPGLLQLRQQIAAFISRQYGCVADPATEITITAGASEALYTAITAFVHPGDEVIIIEPAYDLYAPAITLCGGVVVSVPTLAPDYAIDFDLLRSRVTSRTRMLIINTPNNPTGITYSAAVIDQIAALAEEHDLIVISDEVYEHLIFDGEQHASVLRHPVLQKRAIAVSSFGKTYHATGWKIGYAVAPAALMKEFIKVHQFNTFSVNTPMQYALADYLEQPHTYLGLGQFYQEKRDLFVSLLANTPFKPIVCKGTFFVLADYSAISDLPDTAFAAMLCERYKVAAIPVSSFYTHGSDARVIRFCFAKTTETLMAAGEKLSRVEKD